MAGNKRAREVARNRYERVQQRQAERAAKARRRNSVVAVVAAVVVVGLAVWGIAALVGGGSSSTASAGTTPTSSATSSLQPSGSASASTSSGATSAAQAAAAVGLSCTPVSSAKPSPKTYSSEPPLSLKSGATYTATITTNCGPIEMQLFADKAPHTVNSFVFLAKQGFYKDSVCHRLTTVADGIAVLQCGDPTGTGTGGPGYGFGIENPPADGKYPAGTVAMARSSDPNSNGSQFFITYDDSAIPDPAGYSIFGKVTKGLDIVKKLAQAGPDFTKPDASGKIFPPKIPVQIQGITISTTSGSSS